MSDEQGIEDMIDDSQNDMNDFVSFEEADHTVPSSTEENIEDDEPIGFNDVKLDDEDEKEEIEEPKKEESKEEVSEKPEEKKEAKEDKKLVAEIGDEKIEVSMSAKVMVPIDGKEVEMSLQDVINKASGNEAVDKRFSELNKEKNSYKLDKNQYVAEKTDLLNKVKDFAEAVNKNDGMGAINSLAVLSGQNPIELRRHFKDLMVGQVKAYMEMSPEGQKEFDNQQEVEYSKQENEMLKQQNEYQQTNLELTNSILRFQASNGMDDAALVALYDEAEEKSVIIENAEDLESFYSQKLTLTKSSDLISQVDPSLSSDENALKVVNEFITKNPEMSDEDVIQAIKSAIGTEDESNADSKQDKSLSEKVQSKQKKNQKGKQSASSNNNTGSDEDDDELLFSDVNYY